MKFSARRLVTARKTAGKGLEEVARGISDKSYYVTRNTINNWESGKTKPSVCDLERLADYYGREIWYFFGHETKQTI